MKMKFIYASILTFSSLAYSAPDYTLCSDFIQATNDNVHKTNFSFPFSLNKETGELNTINYMMNLKSDKKSREYSSIGLAGTFKITTTEGDLNKLEKIEVLTIRDVAPDQKMTYKSTIQFNIQNGKCYPMVSHAEFKVNNEDIKATVFDTKLCKNIHDYFANNKSLSKCLDPDSKEGKEINEIFKKSGFDSNQLRSSFAKITPVLERTTHSVEQKIIAASPNTYDLLGLSNHELNKRSMAMSGGSPQMSAYMILNDCYERGLRSTIMDEALWKNENPKKTKKQSTDVSQQ